MYRPGTLVTLKDGNVYRTSKKCVCVCDKCRQFYIFTCENFHYVPCSSLNTDPPFGPIGGLFVSNRRICEELYGPYQFPKLLSLCGKKETK